MSGLFTVVAAGAASLSIAGLIANRSLHHNRQRARRRAKRRREDLEASANWKALQERVNHRTE